MSVFESVEERPEEQPDMRKHEITRAMAATFESNDPPHKSSDLSFRANAASIRRGICCCLVAEAEHVPRTGRSAWAGIGDFSHDGGVARAGGAVEVVGVPMEGFVGEDGEREGFFGVARNAEFVGRNDFY